MVRICLLLIPNNLRDKDSSILQFQARTTMLNVTYCEGLCHVALQEWRLALQCAVEEGWLKE